MSDTLHLVDDLRGLPRSELSDALEEVVAARFKAVLLMGDDEELALDVGYFDLGLTSLRLAELRNQFEALLGVSIDATVLFNQPTVGRLVGYLAEALTQFPRTTP